MTDETVRVPMPWVKLHTRLLDDPHFMQLPDDMRARYYDLLMLAGRCDAGGAFIHNGETMTVLDIDWQLRSGGETKLGDQLDFLKDMGFLILNGRGWQIAAFEDEQGPDGFYGKRCSDWKKRQERSRNKNKDITNDTVNNNELVTHDTSVTSSVKSQSQIKNKSQRKSQKDESVSQSSPQQPTDDLSTTDLKSDLCTKGGIPPKYSRRIIANDQISTEDLLAQMAKNYARRGNGKGQVKNPGVITGMNLSAAPVEKAGPEWYDHSTWGSLPEPIKQKLGIVIQSQPDGLKNLGGVATRTNELRGDAVTKKVHKFFGREA